MGVRVWREEEGVVEIRRDEREWIEFIPDKILDKPVLAWVQINQILEMVCTRVESVSH